MTQWNMRSTATLRMADALLRTVGGGEVALRFPKPAQAGSDAEQLGLSAPAFEDVPIKPAIFRRIYGKPSGAKQGGNDTARYELLLSATAVALQMTALNIGTVAELFEAALGVVVRETLLGVVSVTASEAFGAPYIYHVELQGPQGQLL